jgi:hypothetical protein
VKREEVLHRTNPPKSESGLQAVAEAIDKRRHARVPVSLGVEIVDVSTRVRIIGRATDFGVGGCYVDTMNTFAQGTAVEVFFHWEGRTLHMRALVSYAVSGRSIGMGLSFTGTSTEEGANLLDWITGLGGKPPQERVPEPAQETGTGGDRKLVRAHRLEEIIDELVALLVRKQVLTETEGAELRDRISA